MKTLTKSQNERRAVRPWINDFFNVEDFFDGRNWLSSFRERNMPAVNVFEDNKNYFVDVVAPGFKKEDIDISLDEDMLTISAESKKESEEKGKEYSRREYSYSSFTRTFTLPGNAKHENIDANYSDGILRLSIPKTGEMKTATSKKVPVK